MTKKEFQELLQKYLDGRCSREETRLLKNFYTDFQTEKLWDDALGSKIAFEEDLLEGINGEIERREKERLRWDKEGLSSSKKAPGGARAFGFRVWRMAAAVAVVAIAGAGVWFVNKGRAVNEMLTQKVTQSGQKSTLVLADGTQIRLNAESSLSYPEKFEGNTREVVLEGEAFFDVARDESRPFIIKSGDLVTTVLGTTFNVKAFPNEQMAVTVVSGKVAVQANNQPAPAKSHEQSHENKNNASAHPRPWAQNWENQKATHHKENIIYRLAAVYPDENSSELQNDTFRESNGNTGTLTKFFSGSMNSNFSANSPATSPEAQTVFLTPGHQAILLKDGSLRKRKVNTQQYTAWKDGVIKFNDTSMEEAAAVLERWYGVNIIFEGKEVKYCIIQNATYEDQNLYNILESIKYFLDLDFKIIEGKQIIIDGKGCPPGQSTDKPLGRSSRKFN